MSDLWVVPDLGLPGVRFQPPPVDLQPSIQRAIADAVAKIPPDKSGALVGLVNEHGANAAVVTRLGKAWEVQAWIGKDWKGGALQYGGLVRATW